MSKALRVLVVGSGGREHALVWKLSASPLIEKIFAAPGNPGIAELAECIPLAPDKIVDLANFAMTSKVDLTVVGPEAPLVAGIVDYFQQKGLKIFGPTKAAAQLEGSKAFAKKIMAKYGVPTAECRIFHNAQTAAAFVEQAKLPLVIKADGLAAGKGVVIAQSRSEAVETVDRFLRNRILGDAGSRLVIEEYLQGQEVSVLAVVDGAHFSVLDSSQDHKRIFDQDRGPNTGGMGAYSPVPMVTPVLSDEISRRIFEPLLNGMVQEGIPFSGILYAGLMLTASGPKVLEFNVRFGDPETQAILPRLKTDLTEIILAALDHRLDGISLEWEKRSCACVVLASAGYPGHSDVGRQITGLEQAADSSNTLVFHAGTKKEGSHLLTWGGRVLNVVGLGPSLEMALKSAYRLADHLHFEGKQFRKDIGWQALEYKTFAAS